MTEAYRNRRNYEPRVGDVVHRPYIRGEHLIVHEIDADGLVHCADEQIAVADRAGRLMLVFTAKDHADLLAAIKGRQKSCMTHKEMRQ